MFGWLKKKKPHVAEEWDESSSGFDPSGTIQPLTVRTVVANYVAQPPESAAGGLQALVRAGAGELLFSDELWEVCTELEARGLDNPLEAFPVDSLSERELMRFLNWLAVHDISPSQYTNDAGIKRLIEQFRLIR